LITQVQIFSWAYSLNFLVLITPVMSIFIALQISYLVIIFFVMNVGTKMIFD
jgi:ABC-type transport system involved in cytochrome c biogenesis permease component